MKFVKYIISVLLISNLFYLFSSDTNTFTLFWNLFTGGFGIAYLLYSIHSDHKNNV